MSPSRPKIFAPVTVMPFGVGADAGETIVGAGVATGGCWNDSSLPCHDASSSVDATCGNEIEYMTDRKV
eukprot:COSAG05_NODE_1_length_66591_cov_307.301581_31_plen_69_part_00